MKHIKPQSTSSQFQMLADEAGAAAVEFALIMPIFILMLIGMMNFGYTAYALNSAQNVAIETSRAVTFEGLTASQAETFAEAQLNKFGGHFDVSISPLPANGVEIAVEMPPEDLELVPFPMASLSWFRGNNPLNMTYRAPGYGVTSTGLNP